MKRPDLLLAAALPARDEAALEAEFSVHRLYDAKDRNARLAEIGTRIRAVATNGEVGADATLLEACPNLEIVSVFGVGYDAVHLDTCIRRGIPVTNTPDVLSGDVADLGVGMMISLARGMSGAEAWVRSGSWASKGSYSLGSRVHGRRAGVLGLGRIGTELARRLSGFGMDVAYWSRSPKPEAADNWHYIATPLELAQRSDFLFVTVAASEATRHLVNRDIVEALGKDGMLINISRGSTVDESALIDALRSRALGAAALDVFQNEPNINPALLELENVLVLPHHGSATVPTRKAMGQLMRDNLSAHFRGEPLLTPVGVSKTQI